jgi:hypothetical protein
VLLEKTMFKKVSKSLSPDAENHSLNAEFIHDNNPVKRMSISIQNYKITSFSDFTFKNFSHSICQTFPKTF